MAQVLKIAKPAIQLLIDIIIEINVFVLQVILIMVVMKNVKLRYVIILGFYYKKNITNCSLTCDGNSDANCLTCNTSAHRYYDSNKCLCSEGYFDDGNREECTCHYSWFLLQILIFNSLTCDG